MSLLLAGAGLLAACGPKPSMTRPTAPGPHKYAIFLDGTANDYASETNLSKLRHRVAWQADDETGTFYVEGVGAGNKFIGMATGWGLGHRVRQAYRYLLRNHHDGDEIYIFGFSRGAYSARILASLLHYGGLPDKPMASGDAAEAVAETIYDAYKGEMDHATRLAKVREAIGGSQHGPFAPRKVKFMGLWDTVSALGRPDGTEADFAEPSPLYADQLCNIEQAMHAVSLDDNRAHEFTPVLLTRPYLVEHCFADAQGNARSPTDEESADMLDRTVEEVWFAGAHSDVGGGYPEGRLGGLSINWMLPELVRLGLIGNPDPVLAHPLDCVHNAEQFMGGYVYEERFRDITRYVIDAPYNEGRLKLHPSVVIRMSGLDDATHVGRWESGSPVGLERMPRFDTCFREVEEGRWRFDPRDDCPLELSAGINASSAYWPRGSNKSALTCKDLETSIY